MAQAGTVAAEVWAAHQASVVLDREKEALEARAARVGAVAPEAAAPGAWEGLPSGFSTSETPRF